MKDYTVLYNTEHKIPVICWCVFPTDFGKMYPIQLMTWNKIYFAGVSVICEKHPCRLSKEKLETALRIWGINLPNNEVDELYDKITVIMEE